jgi:NAD(P)-dependent dehydrogenase (short-subunit alcohol dehydrogenase family)
LRIEHIDISDIDGVKELAAELKGEALDLVFLVAGISGSVPKPLHEVSPDEAARVYLVNAYYPIVAAEALSGLLKPGGVIAFMSSMLGSITMNVGRADWETYRTSKAALNIGARSFYNRHTDHPVLSIGPGWVRTDMGGSSATFDVETSCRNVANAIEKHAATPGHRYVNYDGSELPW